MDSTSVVITGAAAGIGRATAQRFLAAGYRVGAFDIDETGLASLARAAGPAERGRLHTATLDVTDADAWRTGLAEFTETTGGTLGVLVNSAGILSAGRFEEIPLAKQHAMVQVNVTGTINGCYAAHTYLAATPGACVINLCSASAIYGQPELAVYGATKFAVRGLSEALDLEWRADGIRVTALWPLFVDTGMLEGVTTGSTRSLGVRLGPDDVADKVVAVAGDRGLPGRLPAVLPRSVHRPVGTQARALFTAASVAPSWVLRQVNARISGV